MIKKTDGFTLIELMVGILCSALVTGAIITFMLMGTNTTSSVMDANADQRNAKIVITMMENLASEGSIGAVEYVGDGPNKDWTIFDKPLDESPSSILSYSAASHSLRGRNGSVLMEGVLSSSVTLSEQKNLLTFNIKTEESDYTTSVYCRTAIVEEKDFTESHIKNETFNELPDESSTINIRGRSTLLDTVFHQLGSNGYILEDRNPTEEPYSLWYYDNKEGLSGNWGIDTPWCAIFISWALDQIESSYLDDIPMEANIDTLWRKVPRINTNSSPDNILPGDLIFFDWDHDTKSATNTDLEHVGVVLYIQNGWVYTIEGNSGNQVAIRRYDWDDPSIYSYGRLQWRGES